jgi:hypothetical protein
MATMSGDVGSTSRRFDSSSSAHLCGSLAMPADSSVAAAVYFEGLSKSKGTSGKQ